MPGLTQECKAEHSEWSGAEDRAREWLQGEGRVSRVDGSVRMKKISSPFCLSRKLGCIVAERFLSQTLAACRALLKNAGLELRTSSQRQSHLPPTLLLRIRVLLTHKVLFTPLAASLRQTDPPPIALPLSSTSWLGSPQATPELILPGSQRLPTAEASFQNTRLMLRLPLTVYVTLG